MGVVKFDRDVLSERGHHFPRLTAYNEDTEPDRLQRLTIVGGFLMARLDERTFRSVYRLHDHKGMLTVGVDESKQYCDSATIEREVEAAWAAVNECISEVHYRPSW
jgi:hypothetical protein